MNSLLAILTAAFSSGITAAMFTSVLTEQRDRYALRRDSIEKLYQKLDADNIFNSHTYSQIQNYLTGRIGWDILIGALATLESDRSNIISAQLFVAMYETSLIESWNDFVVGNQQFMLLTDTYRLQSAQSSADKIAYAKAITVANTARQAAFERLSYAIINLGRAVSSEPPQAVAWFMHLRRWLKGDLPSQVARQAGTQGAPKC